MKIKIETVYSTTMIKWVGNNSLKYVNFETIGLLFCVYALFLFSKVVNLQENKGSNLSTKSLLYFHIFPGPINKNLCIIYFSQYLSNIYLQCVLGSFQNIIFILYIIVFVGFFLLLLLFCCCFVCFVLFFVFFVTFLFYPPKKYYYYYLFLILINTNYLPFVLYPTNLYILSLGVPNFKDLSKKGIKMRTR